MIPGVKEYLELSWRIELCRRETHRLHDEWTAACEKLHQLEREQRDVFRCLSADT